MFWSTYLLLFAATFALDNVIASPAQIPFQLEDTSEPELILLYPNNLRSF